MRFGPPPAVLLLVSVGALLSLWRAFLPDPLSTALEDRLIDLRFQLRGTQLPPDGVVIVGIDESTIEAHGWSPPPRAAFAEAISSILAADPAAIAVDLLLLDPTDADEVLAAALADPQGRVVLAAASGPGGQTEVSEAVKLALSRSASLHPGSASAAGGLLVPRDAFLRTASLGHVNIVETDDRVARRIPVAIAAGDGLVPSMPVEAARRLMTLQPDQVTLDNGPRLRLGTRTVSLSRPADMLLSHYGPRGTIPTVSMADVIDGFVPRDTLAGKAVFVGASADSLSDLFATPFGSDLPGVEVLATATANLVTGSVPVEGRAALPSTLPTAALLMPVAWRAIAAGRLLPAAIALAGVWAAGLGCLQAAFLLRGLVLDGVTVIGALALGSLWGVATRMQSDQNVTGQLRTERSNLARFVSPLLADTLARQVRPDFDRRVQDAAVLFVDLAGFTALSERFGPATIGDTVRRLHALYEGAATRREGVVTGYSGDGAIMVFGLPQPRTDDAARALACGFDLVDGAASLIGPDGGGLDLRVSLHFGPVVAGFAGGDRQAQVSVDGATVNIASRLQDTAKDLGVPLVASQAFCRAAGSKADRLASRGAVQLRGWSEPIQVLALGPDDLPRQRG
jgi:adenylate cyclase